LTFTHTELLDAHLDTFTRIFGETVG
jgi:hypothetical protein